MTTRRLERSFAIALAGFLLIAAAYLTDLRDAPLNLLNDELHNTQQALSLARTGRSLMGDFLPVFFREPGFPAGRDPLPIYGSALFLLVLPLSEISARLPTALVGLLDVVLAYVLFVRMTGRRMAGMLAAGVIATTPAHLIHSRLGIAVLWPLPFLLTWLIGLASYANARRPFPLFISTIALGAAAFAYVGTAVLVPLYLCGTAAWLWLDLGERRASVYVIGCAGLLLPLLLFAYWHVVHPERWAELFGYYESTGAAAPPTALLSFAALQARVSTYWNYFNPTFLFLSGDNGLRYSTGRAGLLLLPCVVLLPIGVYSGVTQRGLGRLLVYALFSSPVVAALQGQVTVQRVLPMVLFLALVSAEGARWLLARPHAPARRLCAVVLLAAAAQWGVFLYDYFGAYQVRSAGYRGGNLRGAIAEVIRLANERNHPFICLTEVAPNIDLYFRFYAVAFDAEALGARTNTCKVSDAPREPAGTIALYLSNEEPASPPGTPDAWQLRLVVPEPDGTHQYSVYEKVR